MELIMLKNVHITIICYGLLFILAIVSVACASSSASLSNATSVINNQVHMKDTTFVQPTTTIKKGMSLVLINDSPALHIIANGSWNTSGAPTPNTEAGAPKVSITINGNGQQSIGPFTTAGTFHFYCSIHPHMNLTVIVQ
jgi:plastocyanin